jgi:hypothetical protein
MITVYLGIVTVYMEILRSLIDTVEDSQDMVTSSQDMLTCSQDMLNKAQIQFDSSTYFTEQCKFCLKCLVIVFQYKIWKPTISLSFDILLFDVCNCNFQMCYCSILF